MKRSQILSITLFLCLIFSWQYFFEEPELAAYGKSDPVYYSN